MSYSKLHGKYGKPVIGEINRPKILEIFKDMRKENFIALAYVRDSSDMEERMEEGKVNGAVHWGEWEENSAWPNDGLPSLQYWSNGYLLGGYNHCLRIAFEGGKLDKQAVGWNLFRRLEKAGLHPLWGYGEDLKRVYGPLQEGEGQRYIYSQHTNGPASGFILIPRAVNMDALEPEEMERLRKYGAEEKVRRLERKERDIRSCIDEIFYRMEESDRQVEITENGVRPSPLFTLSGNPNFDQILKHSHRYSGLDRTTKREELKAEFDRQWFERKSTQAIQEFKSISYGVGSTAFYMPASASATAVKVAVADDVWVRVKILEVLPEETSNRYADRFQVTVEPVDGFGTFTLNKQLLAVRQEIERGEKTRWL